jgi:hypothetical protein
MVMTWVTWSVLRCSIGLETSMAARVVHQHVQRLPGLVQLGEASAAAARYGEFHHRIRGRCGM